MISLFVCIVIPSITLLATTNISTLTASITSSRFRRQIQPSLVPCCHSTMLKRQLYVQRRHAAEHWHTPPRLPRPTLLTTIGVIHLAAASAHNKTDKPATHERTRVHRRLNGKQHQKNHSTTLFSRPTTTTRLLQLYHSTKSVSCIVIRMLIKMHTLVSAHCL